MAESGQKNDGSDKLEEDEWLRTSFTSYAPGRLCLFGEHQDYLGLPVIALALPLSCRIEVTPLPLGESRILYLDALGEPWQVDLDELPPKQDPNDGKALDFALAAVQEAVAAGWNIKCGARCVSTTDIPLQAGCSSSSAFCVAWVQALARLSGTSLTPIALAQMAHRAEVLHFGSPGGTMDHVTSALGGILRIGPGMWDVQRLTASERSNDIWILADSGQPKDTIGHLKRCKDDRLKLLDKLGGTWNGAPTCVLSQVEEELLAATRTNQTVEEWAAREWADADAESLGKRMLEHHEALRDGLLLSTPRLEAMREAAMEAGAFGFKLVGSGGGGTGVAWTADKTTAEAVAKAMLGAGAIKTWMIDKPGGSPGACVASN